MIVTEILLYILKDTFAVISLLCILNNIFTGRFSGGVLKGSLFGVFSVLSIIGTYVLVIPSNAYGYEIIDAVSNAIYILAAFLFVRKPAILRTLTVLFLYFFTVDMLWSFLSPYVNANIIAELVFDIVIFIVVTVLIKKVSKNDDVNIIAGAFKEIPRWMIAGLLFFELTCYYKEFGISSKIYDLFYAISACMIFVCILYLIFRVFRLVYEQNEMQKALVEQLSYSEQIAKSDQQLRSFRHDLKNHLIVINSMFEQGDSQGARNYFSKLTSDTVSFMKRYSTGNTVVDSLLEVKCSAAAENDTEIDFSGMIPPEGIDNKDMCTCMGNLIDNAVEACAKSDATEKKKIEIFGKVKNNMLIITVRNPVDNSIAEGKVKNIKTSKKDIKAHGFGLKNVAAVAARYEGSLDMKIEDGFFISELVLQLNT